LPRSVSRVVRRGDTFYFRIAVPRAHHGLIRLREVKVSLRTCDPVEARLRGRLLSNALDVWFRDMKRMAHLTADVL
jgi:hypothetical protein